MCQRAVARACARAACGVSTRPFASTRRSPLVATRTHSSALLRTRRRCATVARHSMAVPSVWGALTRFRVGWAGSYPWSLCPSPRRWSRCRDDQPLSFSASFVQLRSCSRLASVSSPRPCFCRLLGIGTARTEFWLRRRRCRLLNLHDRRQECSNARGRRPASRSRCVRRRGFDSHRLHSSLANDDVCVRARRGGG